ncbi:MAG TPA: PadR family transcriptional regulator [Candidatus Acidoferrales bacterium]|nr:PadR family transcriptional regulator [Candidatus Acidoferrales bacterium]
MSQGTAQNTLDLLILKTLARGPNHGFGITVHIQNASEGLLRIEEGSLYPALHRLERENAVSSEWKASENGRRARYYKISAAGRKRLEEHEGQWQSLSLGVARVLDFA